METTLPEGKKTRFPIPAPTSIAKALATVQTTTEDHVQIIRGRHLDEMHSETVARLIAKFEARHQRNAELVEG
jgi:hypothetical protein